ISTVTVSPASAPAASCMALLTLSQSLPLPFGSRAARKGKPLIVPSTIAIPRDGSFGLAFLGRVRRVHDPIFSVALGRNNLPLKRIVDLVSCSFASCIYGTNHRIDTSSRKNLKSKLDSPSQKRALSCYSIPQGKCSLRSAN